MPSAMPVAVDARSMTRAQLTEFALSSAPRIYDALKKKFGSKPLEIESCSVTDIQLFFEEAAAMTPKQVRRAKFKFVQDNGCMRNFSLDPVTRVFYREADGVVYIMWNSCYAEGNVAVALPAENDDERFFLELDRTATGAHQPRRHPVRIPTRAGQPCRG